MRRHSRVLAVLALSASLAGPVAGQAITPVESRPPDSPDRPTMELSLDEAVKRALENNADIAVAKFDPQSSTESVRLAQGYYDPFLGATVSQSSTDSPQTSVFSGASTVNSKTTIWDLSLNQAVPTGGVFSLAFNNNRGSSNSVFSTFNPSYNSILTVQFTQPLLKNFRTDNARSQIKIAKKNREISDLQFRQIVINTVANVKNLYYNLIYAIDNVGASRKSLDLAKKLLNENQIRVKVGTMAPLDIVQARSEVATRDGDVIVAEAAVFNAEDALKQALYTEVKEEWTLRVIPTDRPTADPVPVDIETAVRTALEKRTDVLAARKGLERSDINVDLARNQTLPRVDLSASYGGAGVGGTLITRDGFGGPITGTTPGGYGDAVSSVFGRDFPTWTVGVNVTYPILNRQARAASAQAHISKEQAMADFRRLELNTAVEVRAAGRAVDTNFKRVAASKAARILAAETLDAQQKKFDAGMQTNFFVTQAQRDLTVAEVAELQAILDYRRSITNFERVQEAGVGGSGSLATVSTTIPTGP